MAALDTLDVVHGQLCAAALYGAALLDPTTVHRTHDATYC